MMRRSESGLTRRTLAAGGATAGLLAAGAFALGRNWRTWQQMKPMKYDSQAELPSKAPEIVTRKGAMPYRRFGATGLEVSEIGFGSWAIGGKAYGAVERKDSLDALAHAEELGCNFVDTAMVYGDSELVLGEFLRGRRSRWLVATKYSFQSRGMTATVEAQLKRLSTDVIDFYQLHALPEHPDLYDELYGLKKAGKVRFVGASIYTARDIDHVIDHAHLDGVQLPFSLLDPDPFLLRVERLRQSGLGVLIRSTLKEGFLTGKFRRNATFPDPEDQRHRWSAAKIARTVDEVDRFRFLEAEAGSLLRAAVAYPLSYPEVSSVLLGTKTAAQAESNFRDLPGARLTTASLSRILALQDEMDAGGRRSFRALVRRALGLS